MGSLKKKITLVLGVAAGAALTAFAVSKSGQKEIKRLSSKTANLRDNMLDSVSKDLSRIRQGSKEFI